MKPKDLVLELARREGLKKETNIAQLSEIIGHLADIMYENPFSPIRTQLAALGRARAAKRIKEKTAQK